MRTPRGASATANVPSGMSRTTSISSGVVAPLSLQGCSRLSDVNDRLAHRDCTPKLSRIYRTAFDAASRPLSPPKLPTNRLVEYSVPERALFLRYNYFMSTDAAPFASPSACDKQDSRRAKIAPLLAAGMSVRAISAETGIPVGAVHRAKRQLEKIIAQGGQKAAAIAHHLPTSYVVKQDIGGVPQDVRRLTVAVYERAVESAIGRGLLDGRGPR